MMFHIPSVVQEVSSSQDFYNHRWADPEYGLHPGTSLSTDTSDKQTEKQTDRQTPCIT